MIHTFIHFSCVRYGWKMVVGEEDMARGVPFFKTPVAHCSYRSINPHKSAGIISFPRRSYSLIPRVYPLLPPPSSLRYLPRIFRILHDSFLRHPRGCVVSYSPRRPSIENEESNSRRRIRIAAERGSGRILLFLLLRRVDSDRDRSPRVAWEKKTKRNKTKESKNRSSAKWIVRRECKDDPVSSIDGAVSGISRPSLIGCSRRIASTVKEKIRPRYERRRIVSTRLLLMIRVRCERSSSSFLSRGRRARGGGEKRRNTRLNKTGERLYR